MTHKCKSCGAVKPASEFYKAPALIRGHHSTCKSCWDERARTWRKNNWPRAYKTRSAYREKNRERVAFLTRKSALKKRYGISPMEYNALLSKQGGACAICGANEKETARKTLCIDHCHSTGTVRGLLCDPCNFGLGAFKDDPELLRKAAEFIQAYRETLTPNNL